MKRPETLAWEKVREFYVSLKGNIPIARKTLAQVLDVHYNTIGFDEEIARTWVDDYGALERGKKLWEYEVWVLLFIRFATIRLGRIKTEQLLIAFGNEKLNEQEFLKFQEKVNEKTSSRSIPASIGKRRQTQRRNRKTNIRIAG
jgi:hypothetical protein